MDVEKGWKTKKEKEMREVSAEVGCAAGNSTDTGLRRKHAGTATDITR
jgi:hypothetical protein